MPSPLLWTFGPFRLDTANACLWRGEQLLALRPKAFAVLAYLDVHFVSPAPVHSPLGVGTQHAAPLRRLAAYL